MIERPPVDAIHEPIDAPDQDQESTDPRVEPPVPQWAGWVLAAILIGVVIAVLITITAG